MKLGDLRTASLSGKALLAPTKRVTFKVLLHTQHGERTTTDASAILVFLDDEERDQALTAADKAVEARYNGNPPRDAREQERQYHVLAAALRDEENTAATFAQDAAELKRALHAIDRDRVYEAYIDFLAEEYPVEIDEATWKALTEEAEKKSLRDLLMQFGSSLIRRVVLPLAGRYGAPPTPTSSAGAPTS